MALPKPNQPGSVCRLCIQLKTHGMARKSLMVRAVPRNAGREAIFNWLISANGVACSKYLRKSGVS